MNEIARTNQSQPAELGNIDKIVEQLVIHGNLAKLNSLDKVKYYRDFCHSLGLNPLTKPFQLINFQGKEILYATKDATEQLRKLYKVSIYDLEKTFANDLYIVTAKAEAGNRKDAATGAVNIAGLKGDGLANAIMKAETKAKRRVTLSICGLGMLDDAETDTIGNYKKIDLETGEIIEQKEEQPKLIKAEILELPPDEEIALFDKIKVAESMDELKKIHDNVQEICKSQNKKISIKIMNRLKARKSELLDAEDIPQ
jgi:hypothetical protein